MERIKWWMIIDMVGIKLIFQKAESDEKYIILV